MGIVCYCPNGHRVKVKDRFAGQRGLCPQCGAKFRIGSTAAAGGPAAVELPLARFVPLEPAVVATLPRALHYGATRAAAEAMASEPFDSGLHEPPAHRCPAMAAAHGQVQPHDRGDGENPARP